VCVSHTLLKLELHITHCPQCVEKMEDHTRKIRKLVGLGVARSLPPNFNAKTDPS